MITRIKQSHRSSASRSRRSTSIGLIAVGVWAGFLVGCGGSDDPISQDGRSEPSESVLVFAAASLTEAIGDLASEFEALHPEISIDLNLGGSATLRSQIVEGAPADVFASANEANMNDVAETGRLGEDPTVFATNRLTIAVPTGNPAGVQGLADLARDDLLIGLCAREVPCGEFARQALTDAGVTAAEDTNEPDVRALLTKIAAGELDAGIVYSTDVLAAGDRAEAIDFPEAARVVARYPIAPLSDGQNPSSAALFVDFVLSPTGQTILSDHGFGTP